MKTPAQMAAFGAVSVLSFFLDWGLFSALWEFLPAWFPARLVSSVALARCVSLVFNYFCNRQMVFRRASSRGPGAGDAAGEPPPPRPLAARSFPRYLALAAMLLAWSWALLKTVHAFLPRFPLEFAKPAVDIALFAVSFFVQRKYVFAGRCAGPESR